MWPPGNIGRRPSAACYSGAESLQTRKSAAPTAIVTDTHSQPATETRVERDGEGNALRSMTPALMARLFVVPAIIIAVVVGCAVFVTLMFGWTGVGQPDDIGYLIDKLAAGSGEKVAGMMLLPREKELWQAALELANRLAAPDAEFKPDQRPLLAERLGGVLARTLDQKPYTDATRQRIRFMGIALGRLRDPSAIDLFSRMLHEEEPAARSAAVQGMAEMASVAEARRAAKFLIPVLRDDDRDIRIITPLALAQLAQPADTDIITALKPQLAEEDEIRWNVAAALTRLGDSSARGDMLELLTRAYWEKQQVRDDPQSDRKRPISEREIARNIVGLLTYVTGSDDAEIRAAVAKLGNDKNLDISRVARAVLSPPAVPKLAGAGGS